MGDVVQTFKRCLGTVFQKLNLKVVAKGAFKLGVPVDFMQCIYMNFVAQLCGFERRIFPLFHNMRLKYIYLEWHSCSDIILRDSAPHRSKAE